MKKLDLWRLELSVKLKNGINFIVASAICWILIGVLWMAGYPENTSAFFTFFLIAPFMPVAWLLSKAFKVPWTVKGNPLDSLGLWLNFSQLFYFPFVFFYTGTNPDQMPMALALITGAHFFPFAWYYKTISYAIAAGFTSVLSMIFYYNDFPAEWMSFSFAGLMILLSVFLWLDLKRKEKIAFSEVQIN